MIESRMRTKTQPLFDKVGSFLIPYNITPNMITLAAFILGISSGVAVAIGKMIPALVLLAASGLLDVLDGTVARLGKRSEKIGAYIDLISDRMVEAAVILGFAIQYPQHALAYIIFLIAVLMHFSTFVVAGTLFPNMGKKSMHYDKSIVERAEAFIFFFFMMLFPTYIFEALTILNTLIIAAAITRFARVWKYAHQIEREV